MSKELFGRYADNVLREYLKLEKSIRTYFDSFPVCSPCKGHCCRNHTEQSRFDEIATRWDRYVISTTFPEWQRVKENGRKDGYCQFLSEKGCAIPEGRPNACVTHFCYRYNKIISDEANAVLANFHNIGSTMARHMMKKEKGSPDGIYKTENLDLFFKRAAEAINNDETFKQKFDYKGV